MAAVPAAAPQKRRDSHNTVHHFTYPCSHPFKYINQKKSINWMILMMMMMMIVLRIEKS